MRAPSTNGLMGAFLVDVSQDKPDIHPACFCNNCYRAYRQHEKLESEEKDYSCSVQIPQWNEHTTVICATNSPTLKREEGPRRQLSWETKHTEAEECHKG